MAPGAKWIACRNMDQNGRHTARYIECMEFFLAPYPVGGDPSRRPDQGAGHHKQLLGVPPSEDCRLTHCKLLWKPKLLLVL